ncbi:MAG: carboxypeptidase-like regulatory domain-containing protein, partial [Planctomycetota bacterium]
MSRHLLYVLLGLALAAGLAWLLVGEDLLSGRDGADRDASPDGPADLVGWEAGGGTEEGTEGGGALLFGRPRELLVGRGAVVGRVGDVSEGTHVKGAQLLLAGTGYGDEEVALRATSAEDGTFRIPEVAAGENFVLRVTASGLPERAVPAVGVADGGVTNLGTIWLGAKTQLVGRVVDPQGRSVSRASVQVHHGHFSMLEMMTNFIDTIGQLDREPEPLARTETD